MVQRLDLLSEENVSFEKAQQAHEVIQLTFDNLLDDFRAFHSDVLFHQTNEKLFNSFHIAKIFEAVLALRNSDETFNTANAIASLNDFIGHRPIATLETHKACLLYTSPSPRDRQKTRMPSSA